MLGLITDAYQSNSVIQGRTGIFEITTGNKVSKFLTSLLHASFRKELINPLVIVIIFWKQPVTIPEFEAEVYLTIWVRKITLIHACMFY